MKLKAALVLFVSGCASVRPGFDLHNPTPYAPGVPEAVAWIVATDCSGVTPAYPFAWVRWSYVDSIRPVNGQRVEGTVIGLAVPEDQKIYIRREYHGDVALLSHELLHLILPGVAHEADEYRRCDPLAGI